MAVLGDFMEKKRKKVEVDSSWAVYMDLIWTTVSSISAPYCKQFTLIAESMTSTN